MSIEEKEKKKVVDFIKGFLITYCLFVIPNFLVLFINTRGVPVFLLNLMCAGILLIILVKKSRIEHPYISKGMIVAIFGLVYLYNMGNREPIVDLYTDNPKKRKSHFVFGILLSIGLTILYLPLLGLGYKFATALGVVALVIMGILLLNILIGVVAFFFKENLLQISKGVIFSIPLMLCLIIRAIISIEDDKFIIKRCLTI